MSISYTYLRNRKKAIVFNGILDPVADNIFSATLWEKCYKVDSPDQWSIVSAPGGAGGYAHKFSQPVRQPFEDEEYEQSVWLSPFKGNQYSKLFFYSMLSPLKWKYRAEFRLYISADANGGTGYTLSLGGGYALDGIAVNSTRGISYLYHKIAVMFNVTNSKAGIAYIQDAYGQRMKDLYTVSWTGSLNTWYDVRIEYEYDFYSAPRSIPVTVYVNKTQLFQYTVSFEDWRKADSPNHSSHNAIMGKPGIGINASHTSTTGATVTAYFKDILLTQEIRAPIEYTLTDSILLPKSASTATAAIITTDPTVTIFNKATELQFWFRDTSSDDWNGFFRGIIRDIQRTHKKIQTLVLEGYDYFFAQEKMEDITLTTKTAAQIFDEAVNNPDKLATFDTSTYFDSVTATYTRTYKQQPKLDIFYEMCNLEGFLSFLDMGNNFHFQKPRTNQLGTHLEWGSSKIVTYNLKNLDIRMPSVIKVVGAGLFAQRELSGQQFTAQMIVTKTINRMDLTTQAEVDNALDYYVSIYREPVRILEMTLRANYTLCKGYIITVSIPQLNLRNTKFIIISITVTHLKHMTLTLLELKEGISLILSDLVKSTDLSEASSFPTDLAADASYPIEKQLFSESVGTLLVSATYEITKASVVVRSGTMIITDELIDDLLEKLDAQSPTRPTYLAYGSGTTEAKYTDTALGTEISRSSATIAYDDLLGNYTTDYYRSVTYTLTGVTSTISEIGLLNAASAGTLACRTTFASLTNSGGSPCDIKIKISFDILPSPTMPTYGLFRNFTQWLYNNTWTNLSEISLVFSDEFASSPTPQIDFAIRNIGGADFHYLNLGTVTRTLLKQRDEIKFNAQSSSLPNPSPNTGYGIGFSINNTATYPDIFIFAFKPTSRDVTDYYQMKSNVTLWVRIARQETVFSD